MKASEDSNSNNLQAHATIEDDVMVDLSSCFATTTTNGGGYDTAAATAMEDADHQDLMDNAAAIFCDDLIPPLPDFQCMSSSSSTSSSSAVKPVAYRSTASSSVSSSSSSWTMLKSDGEEHGYNHQNQSQSQNNQQMIQGIERSGEVQLLQEQNRLDLDLEEDDEIGCMDVMETLGYMDLLDENGQGWDYESSPVFDFKDSQDDICNNFGYENQEAGENRADPGLHVAENKLESEGGQDENDPKSEDLAMVFFEWLKSNKESISAEDLRSIKLKKSTIESAARRLGNGKDGMKRLLQLILEWVQHHQLQRKRSEEAAAAAAAAAQQQQYPVQYPPAQPFQNGVEANLSGPTVQSDAMGFAGAANVPAWNMNMGSTVGFDPMMAMGVPAAGAGYVNGDPYNISNMVEQQSGTWPGAAPYCMNYGTNANTAQNVAPVAQQQPYPFGAGYSQYPYQYFPTIGNGNGVNGSVNEADGMVRAGSSATKEARKKRMARQRRFLTHHRHHHHSSNNNVHHQNNNGHSNQMNMPVGNSPLGRVIGDENCTNMGQPSSANWGAYWQSAAAPSAVPLAPTVEKSVQSNEVGRSLQQQSQSYQRPIAPERRQGSKPEKNLRFLLQKVLKQSDVGSLGRIVLPKKEAETHLPQLTARDGINIAIEDIGTSRVWNMRYRFWPNNKSRMYLLENTGDFVKTNGLQEGDFIVIYSDIKCGKYMIRGVKVRQQGQKTDGRRSSKSLKKNSSASNGSPVSSPNNTPRKEMLLPSQMKDHSAASMDPIYV